MLLVLVIITLFNTTIKAFCSVQLCGRKYEKKGRENDGFFQWPWNHSLNHEKKPNLAKWVCAGFTCFRYQTAMQSKEKVSEIKDCALSLWLALIACSDSAPNSEITMSTVLEIMVARRGDCDPGSLISVEPDCASWRRGTATAERCFSWELGTFEYLATENHRGEFVLRPRAGL